MYLWSRIRNRVCEAAKAITRQPKGNAFDAGEGLLILHADCDNCPNGSRGSGALYTLTDD